MFIFDMLKRLASWIVVVLVAIDQVAHAVLAGPKYVLVGGPKPNPDETISSKVGRMAVKGKLWARIAEVPINALFWPLEGWGHCRRRIGS